MSGFRDDDQIRERALELALQFYRDKAVGTNPTESRIIEVAQEFYDFLSATARV